MEGEPVRAGALTLTERLLLAPLGSAQLAELRVVHDDLAVAEWYPLSAGEAAEFAERQERSWREGGIGKWLAYERASGELVGRGGGSWTGLDGVARVEIGWAVRGAWQGRGFATEIGAAAIRHAREELGVAEVVAFTEVHNRASRAVMERLGMVHAQEIRRPGYVEGRPGVHPDAPFALYISS